MSKERNTQKEGKKKPLLTPKERHVGDAPSREGQT